MDVQLPWCSPPGISSCICKMGLTLRLPLILLPSVLHPHSLTSDSCHRAQLPETGIYKGILARPSCRAPLGRKWGLVYCFPERDIHRVPAVHTKQSRCGRAGGVAISRTK